MWFVKTLLFLKMKPLFAKSRIEKMAVYGAKADDVGLIPAMNI